MMSTFTYEPHCTDSLFSPTIRIVTGVGNQTRLDIDRHTTKLRTVSIFRSRYCVLNSLVCIHQAQSTYHETTTSRKWYPVFNHFLVGEPDFYLVRLSRLQVPKDLRDKSGTEVKERFTPLGVGTEVEEELAINEEIAPPGKSKADLPISVFVWGKRRGKLFNAFIFLQYCV